MDIEFSLLENGLDFILNAINNLNIAKEESTDDFSKKRLLKYAILNLSTGIELIFKYKLLCVNWTYIFSDMNKASRKSFISGDFKSVDSNQNIERLTNLCDIVFSTSDQKTISNLRMKRNRIEHFNVKDSIESIESIMSGSISLILCFLADHTDLSHINDNENELIEQITKETSKLNEVIESRVKIIDATAKRDGVYNNLITCPSCNKKYLNISDDGEVSCLFCYYNDIPVNIAEAYLSNVMGISSYECGKDGVPYPLYECFECEEESMIIDYILDLAICFNCNFRTKASEIRECCVCGKPILARDELSICSDCLDYKISSDD